MLGELLGLFTYPVTTFQKKAEEKNIKKEAIIALVLAVVIALSTILNLYILATKTVNKYYKSYKKYSEEYSYLNISKDEYNKEKKEAKKELLKSLGVTAENFFKTAGIALVAIALVAGMLYVISRLVKSPKDYLELLSYSNSAFMIYVIGYIISILIALIYSPLGTIISFGVFVFALIALANAFKDSLQLEDINKLVIFSAIVVTVVFAVLLLISSKVDLGLTTTAALGSAVLDSIF